jgi:hypothetical protein
MLANEVEIDLEVNRNRVGYRSAHSRLADTVSKAISLSIARYFADEGG